MNTNDIHMIAVDIAAGPGGLCMMDQEIPGTRVSTYTLADAEQTVFAPVSGMARILFLCCGGVEFTDGSDMRVLNGRSVYAASYNKELRVRALAPTTILEILLALDAAGEAFMMQNKSLPYSLAYDDAKRYTEVCKSPKTVSRMLIPQRLIPKFAMGSVETSGDDLVAPHEHAMLEQFFFGLQENDCSVLINDLTVPFGSNVLLHIPLGSSHGILSQDSQKVHYLWMDFSLDENAALQYLENDHQML